MILTLGLGSGLVVTLGYGVGQALSNPIDPICWGLPRFTYTIPPWLDLLPTYGNQALISRVAVSYAHDGPKGISPTPPLLTRQNTGYSSVTRTVTAGEGSLTRVEAPYTRRPKQCE
jgi:hypothetical protein